MSGPTLLGRYANEGLGPPSDPVNLSAFVTEVDQNLGAYLGTSINPTLDGLEDDVRTKLAERFNLKDLRSITELALADAGNLKNFDIWQKSRYMSGSEEEASIAQAQAILLMTAKHKPDGRKRKAKGDDEDEEAEVEDSMLNETIDPTLQEQIERAIAKFPIEDSKEARTIFARTPMPTAGMQHKPPDHLLPTGLRMYRPFPEARYYMRQTRASDMNTLISIREHERALGYNRPQKPTTGPLSDLLPPEPVTHEILLTLTFHPVRTAHAILRNAGAHTRQQRIILPATHTLADLREAVKCPADALPDIGTLDVPTVTLSSDQRDVPAYVPQRHISGSVFAIEGTLYADTRPTDDPDRPRLDYAQGIRDSIQTVEWPGPEGQRTASPTEDAEGNVLDVLRPPLTLPDYEVGTPMQLVRLNSLNVRLGEPYWFMHQGNCEHVMTFDDIRAVHPTDPKPLSGPDCPYPITTMLSRLEQTKCRICNRDPATRCLIDDELAGDSPTLVCDICFWYLHGSGGQLAEGGAEGTPAKSVPEMRAHQLTLAEQNARQGGVSIIPVLEELSHYVG